MAKYNRDFLVPYLQNICSLQLAKEKLDKKSRRLRDEIFELENGQYNPKPVQDHHKLGCWFYFCVFGAIFCFWGATTFDGSLSTLITICGVAYLVFAIISFFYVQSFNENAETEYIEAMRRYEAKDYDNMLDSILVEKFKEEKQNYESEIRKVDYLLNEVYEANVIPVQYRNLYAAVFLYEWFSTSRADDLDHALSMYVLEEIKDRLDSIIMYQAQSILYQRIMIANQYKTMDQIQNLEISMQEKLTKIMATEEEQLCYTKMIESNTAANAYFSAANYLDSI